MPDRPARPARRTDRSSGPKPDRRRDEGPVLPDTAAEDSDAAWGDGTGARDDDWYRRERPPHHE